MAFIFYEDITVINIIFNYSIDDSFLQRAVSAIPKQAIFLIEDIDCAFPSREEEESESRPSASRGEFLDIDDFEMGLVVGGKRARSRSNVTLSGLLNVLDGVGSEEGKIFFATVCIVSSISCFSTSFYFNFYFADELRRPFGFGPSATWKDRQKIPIQTCDEGASFGVVPPVLP
jgi:hypothetical protein